MQRVIQMSLMSRIFLRDWLRWRCRMQKNSLKFLARPKSCGNNMKTPFLSSFCLSDFRTVIRFPPKNLVPEILKLLTLVVRNCTASRRKVFRLRCPVFQRFRTSTSFFHSSRPALFPPIRHRTSPHLADPVPRMKNALRQSISVEKQNIE